MNKLKTSFILGIFSLVLMPLAGVQAAEGGRYLVKSDSAFWKNAFNARNEFKEGFTANLNDWQVRFGKLLGIEIEPLTIFQILPDNKKNPIKDSSIIDGKSKEARIVPTDQTPWGVEAVYGNAKISQATGGKGARVAVLDTGVLTSHLDLMARILDCKDFSNPRFPVIDGKCEDKNGHGTHVAGIIAADGGADHQGIYGIAPESSLLAFKVCSDNGFCYADDIAVAIRSAVDGGANIINLSLGSDRPSGLVSEAVRYADSQGVLVVAAAGNDGPYLSSIDYPAAQPEAIAVGAFDDNLSVAEWSSQGANSSTAPQITEEKDLEFAAPGVNIESTWKDGGYAILSGTSMAAPFVSGLAAKYWNSFLNNPNPAAALRQFLQLNALDIADKGEDDASGFGFPRVVP